MRAALALLTVAALIGWLSWQVWSLRRRVRVLADRDALTGVASAAGFLKSMRAAASQTAKSGKPLSIAVLDCDHFKQINETLGHPVGDAVLIAVGQVLQERIGPFGVVGRIWGDAFGILLPGATQSAAEEKLRKVQSGLAARMSEHHWPVTFSIGVVSSDRTGADAQKILAAADALMFEVKRGGRNGLASRDFGTETFGKEDVRRRSVTVANAQR